MPITSIENGEHYLWGGNCDGWHLAIIASMPGYIDHEFQRYLEVVGKYILLVRWQSIEDHEKGFRLSPQYQEWKKFLHHFYDPFPVVEHFEHVQPQNH